MEHRIIEHKCLFPLAVVCFVESNYFSVLRMSFYKKREILWEGTDYLNGHI